MISLTHKILAASDMLAQAERLAGPYTNATAVSIDMQDVTRVGNLIAESDVVIRFVMLFRRVYADCLIFNILFYSLLPVPFHPAVAKACIQHKKHIVTASYISPAMRELHERYGSSKVFERF